MSSNKSLGRNRISLKRQLGADHVGMGKSSQANEEQDSPERRATAWEPEKKRKK
jgi:hypothetical protein